MNTIKTLVGGIEEALERGIPIKIEISPNRARQLVDNFNKSEDAQFEKLKQDIFEVHKKYEALQAEYQSQVGQKMWIF